MKCIGCSKEDYCNSWYNIDTGEWMYQKTIIRCPYKAPIKPTFRPIPNGIYATQIEPYL